MSLTSPSATAVDVGRLLEPLRVDLATWVGTQKGSLFFARDPLETLELLAESPAGHRVIMQFQDDRPVGGEVPGYFNPVLEASLRFVVSFNPGLALRRDGALIKGDATRGSLMKICADLRSRLMSYRWPAGYINENRLAYAGSRSYSMSDYFPFAAYEMDFTFVYVPPLPSSTVSLTVS